MDPLRSGNSLIFTVPSLSATPKDYLYLAVKTGNLGLLKESLDRNPEIINDVLDEEGNTALHLAASNGFLDLVQFLMGRGCSIGLHNRNGEDPLDKALDNSKLEVVNELIYARAIFGKKHGLKMQSLFLFQEEFRLAVKNGDLKKVKESLRDKHVNIDAALEDGLTAIHLAIKFGYSEIVKELLDNRADANALSFHGLTPLHIAVYHRELEIVRILLDHPTNPADVNKVNKDGCTPLYMAVVKRYPEMVKMLLERRADANAADREGLTPLVVAVLKKYSDIVEILLKKDVDVNIECNKCTPLELARLSKEPTIIKLLQKSVKREKLMKQRNAALLTKPGNDVLKIEQEKINEILSMEPSLSIPASDINFNRSNFLEIKFDQKEDLHLALKIFSIFFDKIVSPKVFRSTMTLPYPISLPQEALELEFYHERKKRLEERISRVGQLIGKEIGIIKAINAEDQSKKIVFSLDQNDPDKNIEIPAKCLVEESETLFDRFLKTKEKRLLQEEQERLKLENARKEVAERERAQELEKAPLRKEKEKEEEPLPPVDIPGTKPSGGKTELHLAVYNHDFTSLARILYSSDLKEELLNAQTDLGNTALHVAAIRKNRSALEQLLCIKGIDCTLKNANGETAIAIAHRNKLLPDSWVPDSWVTEEKPAESAEKSASVKKEVKKITEKQDTLSADIRDWREASVVIRDTRNEAGPSNSVKKKSKEPSKIHYSGTKGLEDIQVKLRSLQSDYEMKENILFPYILASYTISGILQIKRIFEERQEKLRIDYASILNRIESIRNALVHLQIDGRELHVSTIVLSQVAKLISTLEIGSKEVQLIKSLNEIIDLLRDNIVQMSEEYEIADFYKDKIDRYVNDLVRVRQYLSSICEKALAANSSVTNPFMIFHTTPGFRESVTEIICKIYEYKRRLYSMRSEYPRKQDLDNLNKLRSIRNKQYHECDEREASEPIECEFNPNSENDIFKLWMSICSEHSERSSSSSSSSKI